MKKDGEFRLKLRGKAAVYIDWANVYGWRSSLKSEVDPKNLFKELKTYPQIKEINFYYGLDKHPKSRQLLDSARKIGFNVISKDVKYIPASIDNNHFNDLIYEIKKIKTIKPDDIDKIVKILRKKVLRRKCDFDIEIALDCFKHINKHDSFIFFSGDGDFEPLYKLLLVFKKQVIVVFGVGHLGREVVKLGKRVFLCSVNRLRGSKF